MYCRKCGSWLPDDSNFCNYCGKETKHAKKKKTIPILLILLIVFTGITIFSSKYLIKTLFPAPLNYDELAQAVVKINCYDASGKEYKTGSGVVFPYNNVIVTNNRIDLSMLFKEYGEELIAYTSLNNDGNIDTKIDKLDLNGKEIGRGIGKSKKLSEMEAARDALAHI